jgi:spermidine synthase
MPANPIKADLWLSEHMSPWDIYAHGITKVWAHSKTAYQEMYIVTTGLYGKALVLDGKWQSSSVDEFLYHESLVHPAMIYQAMNAGLTDSGPLASGLLGSGQSDQPQPGPRRVLVLGGGEGATVREALRWQTVEQVVMVDIDGEVVEACREHMPEMHQNAYSDPRVQIVIDDALNFIDSPDGSGELWDVIISDLSDPVEEGPSFQLFTTEYFEKIRRILSPDGVFVVQSGSVSPPNIELYARLARTLSKTFPYTLPYSSSTPSYGEPWGFILGSANPLDRRPDPDKIDQLLKGNTTGGFRLIDGETFLGIAQVPLYIRQAIARETRIYTLAEPPKSYGKGILNQ